jgi:beta-lactamase class D
LTEEKCVAYFDKYQTKGCFVLYNLESDEYYFYNKERVQNPFTPASTFKILNSLIALQTGAVDDISTIIEWDGIERRILSWNKNHNIKSAYKNSVVWFYQELARRVGNDSMLYYVKNSEYGNMNINGGIDRFWLDGALKISAIQQVDFITRLIKNELPFSGKTISMVKNIMIADQTEKYTLRAKTGWGIRMEHDIGWYVGYIENERDTVIFAMNIDMNKKDDKYARINLTRDILQDISMIN